MLSHAEPQALARFTATQELLKSHLQSLPLQHSQHPLRAGAPSLLALQLSEGGTPAS